MNTSLKSLVLFFCASAAALAASIDGTWKLETDIAGNQSVATITLKQEGNKISGSTKMPDGKNTEITGEVDGNKFKWQYSVVWEGNTLTMVHNGTQDSSGTIAGSVEVQPMGIEGSFSAKKEEAK